GWSSSIRSWRSPGCWCGSGAPCSRVASSAGRRTASPTGSERGEVRNPDLARDHVQRAGVRGGALDVLFDAGGRADAVREAPEVVELGLKGLVRARGIVPRRIHDGSEVPLAERRRLPREIQEGLEHLVEASRQLRRDRELAFYGAGDLTPSGFY